MNDFLTTQVGAATAPAWPDRLRPGALRWARSSRHFEATVAFYRDLVGLPVVAEFAASFGEDGVVFGLPDTSVQMEIVRARSAAGAPEGLHQLVLYLDGSAAVTAATAPLRAAGLDATTTPHPYWAANGAVTFADPDGREVVFAPWVYGRDPDPVDRTPHPPPAASTTRTELRVGWYGGDRALLRPLFEEAEDSAAQLDAYLGSGRVLAAWHGDEVVGHLQLVGTDRSGEVELKNMAVVPGLQGTGVGRTLVEAAITHSRADGAARMVVATAAAGTGVLRFYQRCGFRLVAVERDAFTPDTGYPEPVVIDGIPLRDRVWLAQDVRASR